MSNVLLRSSNIVIMTKSPNIMGCLFRHRIDMHCYVP